MQEIAIILSSLAGVATAAAVKKAPRNKTQLLSIGASAHIKNQIASLKIEKDILSKTISRLYQNDSDLSKIQRDKLLIKYQHQLGIILARLEKLEDASKHPDLGPIGDGLITLMDQKLSKLDDRLYEISSKLAVSKISTPEIKKELSPELTKKEEKKEINKKGETSEIQTEPAQQKNSFNFEKPEIINSETGVFNHPKERHSFELTTLTQISRKEPKFPLFEKQISVKEEIITKTISPKSNIQDKIELIQEIPSKEVFLGPKPDLIKEVEKITKFKALPEPQNEKPKIAENIDDEFEEDSDDIDKIKNEILNVLSKLDQAEVE